MLIEKQNRIRDKKHLRWVASQRCCVTLRPNLSQAAHVSKGRNSQSKSGDNFVIPLSWEEHHRQHQTGEARYWNEKGYAIERVKKLGNDLYEHTGDDDMTESLIYEFRMHR